MVKIQVKRPNGQWMTVATVGSDEGIVSNRLDVYEKYHKKARAVDSSGRVVDYRY